MQLKGIPIHFYTFSVLLKIIEAIVKIANSTKALNATEAVKL